MWHSTLSSAGVLLLILVVMAVAACTIEDDDGPASDAFDSDATDDDSGDDDTSGNAADGETSGDGDASDDPDADPCEGLDFFESHYDECSFKESVACGMGEQQCPDSQRSGPAECVCEQNGPDYWIWNCANVYCL